ncbi:M23 family metallopeptidase [Bacillus thuringiensis]|uniref:Peptidase M23 n=1 Tax=Bacillus thuringiensis TaxID=1428 RepID=A0A9X7BPQ6_BACTU|nr:M23 family metallopeptidase [Bacillus thuringiensis]MED4445890.1 M23 family metallopeptidase [Bacillus cereus]PEB44989.1 peptidase M23 [Bacillus thuringiensis]PED24077.1 peptidase M23 [Bacillus thuringiensis]PFL09985.1 peptidase M23 [Bacillus thuringiensis]PFV31644.1 peptidase M23 [Bacillus thuringiensis]
MPNVFDHRTPAPQLLNDVMRKVNALGHEPRVIIEFDKMAYVPGMKNKFEVWDRIREASIVHQAAEATLTTPVAGAEPSSVTKGGESGDRFEYIKCALNKWVKHYKCPNVAYFFLLAVAKHETGFGTLGQGKPENGSYIVGYGCPGSCKPAYKGIDTQAKYAAKRFSEAMRSRYGKISNGYMDASDVDYFHEGGDKGYKKWKWSADGPNWKKLVKSYFDRIIGESSQKKWHCKESGSIINKNLFPKHSTNLNVSKKEDCGCEKAETYTIEEQRKEVHNASSNALSGATFPVEGISFGNGAKVSSHHMKHKGGGARSGHKGTDIVHTSQGKINGMWVVAAWAGYVHKAYKSTSYGNCVMIQHGNGYMTVYAHMQNNSLQVRKGDLVNPGTRLGKAGNTGQSYGAHLHFEIWKGEWIYGGNNHIDPYPVLTGAQKLGVAPSGGDNNGGGNTGGNGEGGGDDNSTGNGSGVSQPPPQMTITQNIKFNKCFDRDANLDGNWHGQENITHFTAWSTGEKYLGFNENIAKGAVEDFGYKHNFSSDGFYEYAFYADLKEGDSVTVTYDGMIVKRYTKENNTTQPTYEPPVYAKWVASDIQGVNSHILDFSLNNVSGEAVFGLKCFKVVEIETQYGAQYVDERIKARKRDVWVDTGAFVYDKTFTVDQDVLQWEINSHFDARVATARITLDNKHGIYSPTYERANIFPENLREAEMSYYENGAIRHVLSEATPVRIYAGYGENLVRVFTGRIRGEIEQNSDEKTITINCVDMYDMLEEHVFDRVLTFPRRDEIHGDEKQPVTMWVKSSIIHNIVNEAGMIGWRIHEDDLRYADAIIEETYYIDIDRGGKKAIVWDTKSQQYVEKDIATVQDAQGYKNPYVQAIDFLEGTRASDAVHEVIGDIMYRSYCDRYGTFRLENIRKINASEAKWSFIDGENLYSLSTSIDHSRIRNHLIIVGNGGQIEHFVDKDLLISTKGNMRTAKIVADWIDERFGSNARGTKEDISNKLFFDMKRQARTFNAVVKGNPMIELLDGCYVYDSNTSNAGYYVIKGNRLVGNKEGMLNFLEFTWHDKDNYYS